MNRRHFLGATSVVLGGSALFPRLLLAGPKKAYSFIHIADTQGSLAPWEKAVQLANKLKPAFVVVGGDLINNPGNNKKMNLAADDKRAAAYLKIARTLDKSIPLYNVAGNHDVYNEPNKTTYAWYQKTFGKLWYTFDCGFIRGIVLESNVLQRPNGYPAAVELQLKWLQTELARARKEKRTALVFMHHPLYIKAVDEKDGYFNMRGVIRTRLLQMFQSYNVPAVFSGHYHAGRLNKHGKIDLVTTAKVNKGFRIVKVAPGRVDHKFYTFEDMPKSLGR